MELRNNVSKIYKRIIKMRFKSRHEILKSFKRRPRLDAKKITRVAFPESLRQKYNFSLSLVNLNFTKAT